MDYVVVHYCTSPVVVVAEFHSKRVVSMVHVLKLTLMMVDSLEMRDEDRAIIVYNCTKTPADRILLTHGTDRMVETARLLAESNIEGKTIVLTGAMIPYAFGTSSDGFFNLGSALAFSQVLPPGVYVVMNGRYFLWDRVRKNRQTGTFEEINTENSSGDFSI